MAMKIAFRVDASLQMGTGHVMRCLTLAKQLQLNGHQVLFICRPHEGHLNRLIEQRGFEVVELSVGDVLPLDLNHQPAHAGWLGCSWQQDADQVQPILTAFQPDWLVVDHYALDNRWQVQLRSHYKKLMVIDDLADRPHQCDLLLDQTYGINKQRYRTLLPTACRPLLGTEYALLRAEFAAMRETSLNRREQPSIEHLLVTLGGVDADNETSRVLQALQNCNLPGLKQVTVVLGPTAPWLKQVKEQVQGMPWQVSVLSNVSNMAELMSDADLAIGAAGSTSWERCCLGLPTIMLILAENQKTIAGQLEGVGAARIVARNQVAISNVLQEVEDDRAELAALSDMAAKICDGLGVERVVNQMEKMM